jgi:inorganic pyrophosphatase
MRTSNPVPTCPRSRASRSSISLHYKDLAPGKWVKLMGLGEVEAHKLIAEAIVRGQRK